MARGLKGNVPRGFGIYNRSSPYFHTFILLVPKGGRHNEFSILS